MLDNLRSSLQGYKTYLIAAALIISALLGWLDGAPWLETLDEILLALGLGTLRAGIARDAGSAR